MNGRPRFSLTLVNQSENVPNVFYPCAKSEKAMVQSLSYTRGPKITTEQPPVRSGQLAKKQKHHVDVLVLSELGTA